MVKFGQIMGKKCAHNSNHNLPDFDHFYLKLVKIQFEIKKTKSHFMNMCLYFYRSFYFEFKLSIECKRGIKTN